MHRPLDDTKQTKTENITGIFSNIGEGYADSDEEEAAVKRRRWANFESDDDDFFVSDPGKIYVQQKLKLCCLVDYSSLTLFL